jgi:hypothetical protein
VLRLLVLVALVALAAAPAALVGADKEAKKEIRTKATRMKPAAAIDFGGSLGLSLPSLRNLGTRIDAAQHDCDPVVLTELARELAAAEEVSGKTAAITGKDLSGRAVEMARYRNRPEELRVVARLCGDDKMAGDLNAQADKAADSVKTRVRDAGSTRAKAIPGTLTIINNCRFSVRIYVNFKPAGELEPFSTAVVYLGGSPFETIHLSAETPNGRHYWKEVIDAPGSDHVWILNCE